MPWPNTAPTYGTYEWFRMGIGVHLEWGADQAVWTTEQAQLIDWVTQGGLFQFYFPPPLPAVENKKAPSPHVWSFLFPVATLSVVAGTGTYELPTNFAGITKDFVYGAADKTWRISVVPPEQLRQALDKGDISNLARDVYDTATVRTASLAADDPSGYPVAACIEPKTQAGTAKQLYQVTFYPKPHANMTLTYRYQVQPEALTTAAPYPLGSLVHTETILASCLACLYDRHGKGSPQSRQVFLDRLAASIAQDQQVGEQTGNLFPILNTDKGGLQVDYFYLQRHVGNFLEIGWNPDSWTYEQIHTVDEIIESGVRRYYYPEPVDAAVSGHMWSFLQPVGSITTAANQRVYELPIGFERFVGPLTYDDQEQIGYPDILVTSENRLRQMEQEEDLTATPAWAATRVRLSGGMSQQRQELILHPTPDSDYTLSYQYVALAQKLSRDNPVPLGGPAHAEGILSSCMAVAEESRGIKNGARQESFKRRLIANMRSDSQRAAQHLGYNSDRSTMGPMRFASGRIAQELHYNGDLWDG